MGKHRIRSFKPYKDLKTGFPGPFLTRKCVRGPKALRYRLNENWIPWPTRDSKVSKRPQRSAKSARWFRHPEKSFNKYLSAKLGYKAVLANPGLPAARLCRIVATSWSASSQASHLSKPRSPPGPHTPVSGAVSVCRVPLTAREKVRASVQDMQPVFALRTYF